MNMLLPAHIHSAPMISATAVTKRAYSGVRSPLIAFTFHTENRRRQVDREKDERQNRYWSTY
jgi:hypothetical protein